MDYLIAGEVTFSMSRLVLTNTISGDDIHLPPAAALILLILVRNHGRVVERDRIIDIAWVEFGLELSGNTLNQYISLLRKNISRLGIESEAIITVTRVGFCFSDKIEVKASEVAAEKNKTQNKKWLLIIAALLIIFFEIGFIFIYSPSRHDSDLVRLGTLNECEIFSTRNISNTYATAAKNIAKSLSLKYLPCHKNSVYLFDANNGLILQHDGRAYLSRCDVSPETGEFAGCQEVIIYETR